MAWLTEDFFGPHHACLEIGVCRSSRWAFALDASGKVLVERPRFNRQANVDELIAEASDGACDHD